MNQLDRRLRASRGPKPEVDPWRPHGVLREPERRADGSLATALTVFLAGRECPFTCVFCDLWRFTTDAPTPTGAIPAQLRRALGDPAAERQRAGIVKLYNASNFFDAGSVPPADDAEIAELVGGFERVVVECHPRLVGRRCFAFAERLGGTLEVAMGLETVHPGALPRLNKKATVDDFDRAADRLQRAGIGLRAFVLVGAPFVPPAETVLWAERSARHALAQGAGHVALIPVRGGAGELARLAASGDFTPPALGDLEASLARCLELGGVVTADLWDLERFAHCRACFAARRARLERINLGGRLEEEVDCAECAGDRGGE